MRRSLALPGVCAVAGAGLGPAAWGDINPMEGTQRLHGLTTIRVNDAPVATGSFDVQAPDPMASWAPPTQNAGIIAAGSFVQLESSLISTIGPSGVIFSMITIDQLEGYEPASSTASLEFSALFDLRFSIGAPGLYMVSASILRAAAPLDAAATITFGAEGQAPIVHLENAGGPWPPGVNEIFPETTMFLDAGIYTIRIQDDDTRSGGPHSYLHHSKVDFSLTVVPGPGTAMVLAVGMGGWARRRRRCGPFAR